VSDEIENQRLQRTLTGTDDAMVWAEEFCRIFDGFEIAQQGADQEGTVNEGTMVAWFANAMQTAIDIHAARIKRVREGYLAAGEPVPEAFVEGFEEGRGDE